MAVSYMQNHNLDVFTVSFLELVNHCSKMVMSLWHLFNEAFAKGMADMKNPKSMLNISWKSFL